MGPLESQQLAFSSLWGVALPVTSASVGGMVLTLSQLHHKSNMLLAFISLCTGWYCDATCTVQLYCHPNELPHLEPFMSASPPCPPEPQQSGHRPCPLVSGAVSFPFISFGAC